MYDLEVDVGETTDIAAQRPDLVQQAANIAKASHTDSPLFPVQHCHGS